MWRLVRFGMGVGLLSAAFGVGRASGMGMEDFGPAGEFIGRSPDWPQGVEDVLRHPSRVYWNDVNGSQRAYYDGDLGSVNQLLDLYSRVALTEHPVVILAGRPVAKSFHGKLTPYVVNFDVPGRLEVNFRQRNGDTSFDSLMPQLTVCLDGKLVEQLDSLKIPKNVTLHAAPIRKEAALEQLLIASDPAGQTLRKRVADFVSSHPQRDRVLNAEELLAALKKTDAEYAKGFTARGTRVEPAPSGPGKLVGWTITMGGDRLVVEQRDVEDADHPPAAGRFEYAQYVGPTLMGSIHGNRVWVDGKLIEAKPQAEFEPVGSTYDLLIGRVLWPLGRGFSSQIDRITKIAPEPSGVLRVTAESDKNFLSRWELTIDPRADFLVRAAEAYRREESTPAYSVQTAGTLTGDRRSVAHTARWIEGAAGPAVSIAVTSVSAAIDEELIEQTEERLGKLPVWGQ